MDKLKAITASQKLRDSENQKLEVDIRQNRLKLGILQSEIHKLHSKKMDAVDKANQCQKDSEERRVINNKLREEETKIRQSISKVQSAHEAREAELGKYADDLDKKHKDLDALIDQAKKRNKDIGELGNQLNARIQEAEVERTEYEALKKDAQNIIQELSKRESELGKKFVEVVGKSNKLDIEVDRAKQEADKHKAFVSLVDAERETLKAGKKVLESQRNALSKERGMVTNQLAILDLKIKETDAEKAKMLQKQRSLDGNIIEIENEKNRLEIVRLRIDKILLDHKNIKELEALRKIVNKDK